MQTKWSILTARAEELERQVRMLARDAGEAREQLAELDAMTLDLPCSGCGEMLLTEGDFARHFEVADETFLNLGTCPGRTADRAARWDLPSLDATRTDLQRYR